MELAVIALDAYAQVESVFQRDRTPDIEHHVRRSVLLIRRFPVIQIVSPHL